jgi:hypothetical protein
VSSLLSVAIVLLYMNFLQICLAPNIGGSKTKLCLLAIWQLEVDNDIERSLSCTEVRKQIIQLGTLQ